MLDPFRDQVYESTRDARLGRARQILHAVRPGPANQSYGLQVAQLAGIPRSVIDKARDKLGQLESETVAQASTQSESDHPMQSELFPVLDHPAVEYLKRLNPDEISAKEALAILYELKQKTDR